MDGIDQEIQELNIIWENTNRKLNNLILKVDSKKCIEINLILNEIRNIIQKNNLKLEYKLKSIIEANPNEKSINKFINTIQNYLKKSNDIISLEDLNIKEFRELLKETRININNRNN